MVQRSGIGDAGRCSDERDNIAGFSPRIAAFFSDHAARGIRNLASRMQSWNWSFRSVAGVLLEMPVDKPHGAVAGVAGAHRFMPQGQQPGAAAH